MSSKMTRRAILKAGLASAAVALLPGCGSGGNNATNTTVGQNTTAVPLPTASVVPTPIPPKTVSQTLNVQMATNTVEGKPFIARSYNGALNGPTIRVRAGDTLQVTLNNQLPANPDGPPHDINIPHQFNSTNLHTHGLHVSPMGNSDNIFVDITPGTSFNYSYKIPSNHPAGTFWYHPHKHGSSTMQLFSSMAGLLIVEGDIDQVPEIAAARDVGFLITEVMQDATGQVPAWTTKGSFKPQFRKYLVNGLTTPTFTIRPGEVQRWRIVCGGTSWNIPFQIEGHALGTIAYDGITIPNRIDVTSELLAPGNRLDVLIKGGAPGTYKIFKQAHQQANPIFGAIATTPQIQLATLVVTGDPVTNMGLPIALPAPKSLPNIQASEVTGRRTVVYAVDFSGTAGPSPAFPDKYMVDGKSFNPDRIDQLVQLGAVEEWTLTNTMPETEHPFHIHTNPFQVVSINGVQVPPRWQDTVNLPYESSVVIRTRFEDFTGVFVNHCHFLQHEDQGMMQTVSVV